MQVLSASVLIALLATAAAAESPFAGTWKLNRDKSEFDTNSGVINIESQGQGIRYVSSVGPIYGGALDGIERPGLSFMAKDKFKLEKSGDRGFEATQYRNGKPVTRDVIEVSEDGRTLTSQFTPLAAKDGFRTTNVFTYTREAGELKPFPFIGTWKMDRSRTRWGSDPIPMTIAESGDALTITTAASENRTTIDLGKSTVSVSGQNQATDLKQTVRKIDARSFELGFVRGPMTGKTVYSVSPDGKTMTLRYTTTGEGGKSSTGAFTYERQ